MITKETCAAIWNACREIEAGEKLLANMQAERDKPFGEDDRHAILIGIPSGGNGHKLFDVSPALAESVIRVHIENKRAELAEANERARIELMTANVQIEARPASGASLSNVGLGAGG